MSNNRKRQSGQTLMEAIFALWILIMVVSAILALTIASIGGQKESESQIIANNLAREGIEVVRSFRDANWLAGDLWDLGFSQPANNKARAEFNEENYTWSIVFQTSNDLFSDNYLLYTSAVTGLYTHNNAVGNKPANFYRRLILDNICQAENEPEEIKFPCIGDEKKIGISITVQVGWIEKGQERTASLQDLIYDWK